MSLLDVRFWSESLGKQSSMYVLCPDGPGPFPVLYLLHGLGDDHTAWMRWTNLERCWDGLPLIVAMPDAQRSFYCNDRRSGGGMYEDHIVKDVVGYMDATFHTMPNRRGRALAGLSMGGYGAVMLALRHSDEFSTACSHSACMTYFRTPRKDRPELDAIAARHPKGTYDCFALARKHARKGAKLALRLDCGTEDSRVEANREFSAHLKTLGVKHEYAEFPGEHDWRYWDARIGQTLEFVMKHVAIK